MLDRQFEKQRMDIKKTLEAVMGRLAPLLGMPSWLEVTVEEDGALDMSDF